MDCADNSKNAYLNTKNSIKWFIFHTSSFIQEWIGNCSIGNLVPLAYFVPCFVNNFIM